jgi:hypothetical protein
VPEARLEQWKATARVYGINFDREELSKCGAEINEILGPRGVVSDRRYRWNCVGRSNSASCVD